MLRKTKLVLLLSASAFALTACVNPNAYPNDPNARTRNGAIAGALLGGAFGLTRKGHGKLLNGVVGAGVGAAIGGAIGAGLDKQAAELRGSMNSNVRIVNTGSELVVTMSEDILFATDSAVVRPDLKPELRALAQNLQRYPDTTVEVVGHTDNTGPAAYNQRLSTRRAVSVADELIANGVAPRRVRAYGRGEDEPIAANATAAGRARNRRVEFIIRPFN